MKIFIKYFLYFLTLLTALLLYFLYTTLGHQNLGYFVEEYLSKKTYNEIKVHSLNLKNYPYIIIDLTVNDTANILLKGEIDNYRIHMDYHLKGESFKFNDFSLEDNIELNGSLNGPYSKLLVEGKGTLFDGSILFRFTKVPKQIEDMSMILHSVNSQKILKFLKKPSFIRGEADIEATFESFSKYKKRGQAEIVMREALMPELAPNEPFSLTATIDFDDITYNYSAKIDSKIGKLLIENGEYNQSSKVAQANYALHLKDLAYFEKFLEHKYIGSLDTNGTAIYNNGLLLKGDTNKFGGRLEYVYKEKSIDLNLKEVYLERLLEQFSYPILLRSDVSGTINYNMEEKILLMDTKLKKTRFIKTKVTKMLYDSVGIDLLAGTYNKSTFTAGYQDNLLRSELKIDDGESHLYLTETKMNATNNQINSKFELKMQGQEIYGDIYGDVQDPKVSVDMSRLLKYQMNKQMDTWLGIENSEVVKQELKSATKDVTKKLKEIELVDDVTETAESFINSFFLNNK